MIMSLALAKQQLIATHGPMLSSISPKALGRHHAFEGLHFPLVMP